MNVYRVDFSLTGVTDIKPIDEQVVMDGKIYCEFQDGLPLFAIIKAPDETIATKLAEKMFKVALNERRRREN